MEIGELQKRIAELEQENKDCLKAVETIVATMQAEHEKQLAEAQADKEGLIDSVRQLAVPNGNLPYAVPARSESTSRSH